MEHSVHKRLSFFPKPDIGLVHTQTRAYVHSIGIYRYISYVCTYRGLTRILLKLNSALIVTFLLYYGRLEDDEDYKHCMNRSIYQSFYCDFI
jgi:hypothetical protein